MRITICIWNLTLSAGGIGKVGTTVANSLSAEGHTVSVIVNSRDFSRKPFYPLNDGIPIIYSRWIDTPGCRKAIRKAILKQNPEVVIAMTVGKAMRWWPHIMKGTGIPVVLSEHSNPWVIEKEMWNHEERQIVMALGDRIHFLLPGFSTSIDDKTLSEKIVAIPNPIEKISVKSEELKKENHTVLAVGRLEDDVKQFSLLIKAFALLKDSLNDWNLKIVGGDVDGSKDKYLELINDLNLKERVFLVGEVETVDLLYREAAFLCHPSRYEGFGLVLVEGYGYGLPAVGFAQCSGVNELIKNNLTGFLSDPMDEIALSEGLKKLMEDDSLRMKMSENALKEAEKFTIDCVTKQWIDLLENIQKDKTVVLSKANLENLSLRKRVFLKKRYLNDSSFAKNIAKEIYSFFMAIFGKFTKTVISTGGEGQK